MSKKVGFITGGSKGIGLAIAESMLDYNMDVAITGRSIESLQEAKNMLDGKYNADVLILQCNAASFEQQQAATQKVLDTYGQIDVLIANAGVGHFAPIDELTVEQWDQTIDINLSGVFYSVKSSVEAIKQSKGYIITIASLAGTNFFEQGSAYNASKFGLVGFTQAIMLDLRKHDVKVSTIMPGSVSTYFNGRTPTADEHWKIQPEDLGSMVIDLLKMNPRTLPSKIEVRPSFPHKKGS